MGDAGYRVQEEGLIRSDIAAYLKRHEEKDLLRFLTCGSVDDGKSTGGPACPKQNVARDRRTPRTGSTSGNAEHKRNFHSVRRSSTSTLFCD